LKLVASGAGTEDSARLEVLVDAVPHPVGSPETGPTPVEETAPVGADSLPIPATDDATTGQTTAICISDDLPN
jgi:hypothetical protein